MAITKALVRIWIIVLAVAATIAVGQTPPTSVESVKIGDLTWTKQNVNIEMPDSSWCYDNDPANCAKCGRLYTWEAAKKACASMGGSWRLPDSAEWRVLEGYGGGRLVAGKKLKSTSGWKENDNGTDDFGFSALPCGSRSYYDGNFGIIGNKGYWWSATGRGAGKAYYRNIGGSGLFDDNPFRSNGYSVRCVSGELAAPETIAISQANLVDSVRIGSLMWTKQNINIKTPSSWWGSWCYGNDDFNCAKYGRLYTWDAAKKACQSMGGSWRLPTDKDWDNLMEVVGGVRNERQGNYYENGSKKLKSKSGWNKNSIGTDDYGFTALPGGLRGYDEFSAVGRSAYWWSATEYDVYSAYQRNVGNYSDEVYASFTNKSNGQSVRCVAEIGKGAGVAAQPTIVNSATPATITADYGLALTNFVVKDGRTSASHGEKFPITLKATTVGLDAFPEGQIGVALVGSKGDIVAVINTREWKALESWEERSQNMSTVSVPKTVAPGRYSLMVVARPAGGEWRVVTVVSGGVSAGIDFTVK